MQVSTTISVAEHLKQNQQRQQLKDVNLKQLDKCDVIVKITMTWVLMTCPPSLLPNLVLEECAPKIKNPVSGVSSRFRQGLRSVRSKIKLWHLSWDGNSRRISSSSLRLTDHIRVRNFHCYTFTDFRDGALFGPEVLFHFFFRLDRTLKPLQSSASIDRMYIAQVRSSISRACQST